MAIRPDSDREELVEHTSPASVRTGTERMQENRYIFNGEPLMPEPQAHHPAYARPRNRRWTPRKRWPTSRIVLFLTAAAIAIVLYVHNILTVNRLAREIHEKQGEYDRIVNKNNILRAEINRKSAWDRIGKIATEELGLKYAKETPATFDVDEKRLEQFSGR